MGSVNFLAFDLGASSGRGMIGKYDGSKIQLEEIHRFENQPVSILGSIYWDVLRLFHEIKQGILIVKNSFSQEIKSLGIDTWGVDFGLLDNNGNLLMNPYHYRDRRTEGMLEKATEYVSLDKIYNNTGIQIMRINTIFQLLSMKEYHNHILEKCSTLLMMPDLLNYFLTGIKSTEYTIASTTELFSMKEGKWAENLIEKFKLPINIFINTVMPGTVLGNISKSVSEEFGQYINFPVVSVASHDTASAIAAIPVIDEKDYAYISSGTWSLMGVEIEKPIINQKTFNKNFTNEGGVNNTIRFLKNIMGLWLIQECKRQWEREGEKISYSDFDMLASSATPLKAFINVDYSNFETPGNMPKRIIEYVKNTNQPLLETKGEIIRCIKESLAFKYRSTIEDIEEILGKKLNVVHIIGGGIKDKMLCQFTANATKKTVIAGPVEATSLGNILLQAIALKEIKDINEARQVVKDSIELEIYTPKDTEDWDCAYEKYQKVINLK
ncbi:rhamnulokinase family protein [Caldicellulosiruptoraceae bacterium PP1]